ncbi:hypothetical protein EDB86DRAFT_2828040 [Lactarius hatsudake]|nr:hypothetical protein EDB86DRAFT_2828040 [Lactarius hatsudake]
MWLCKPTPEPYCIDYRTGNCYRPFLKPITYTSRPISLIPEMAHSLLPTPNLLLQMQKRYLLPSTLPLSLQPERKLWPAVPKDIIVPAPLPAPVLALAFKKISLSLLSSSPKLRHCARWPWRTTLWKVEQNTMSGSFGAIHAAATLRELDLRWAEQRCELLEASPSATEVPHLISQLQLRIDRFAIAATRTLASLFVFIYVLQADSRLVLQVTRPDIWAVDLLVKDMMREELEQELDEGWNLDLDSDIGDEDRVIRWMQDFVDENDNILRAKNREQRTASSGPSTAASLRKQEGQAAASVSIEMVLGHIWCFVQDLGSALTLLLPPTARHMRNSVVSGAHAFSLKSQSEGKNATRFTRLIEMTLGDMWVDERNVAWVLAKPPPPPHGGGGAGEREGKGKGGEKDLPVG